MSLTVLNVVASTRADHGGTSRSVPTLCEALGAQGINVHLVTTAPSDSESGVSILPRGNVTVHVIEEAKGLFFGVLRSPSGFYAQLWTVIQKVEPDVIHDHGAWLPSNTLAAWTAYRSGTPLVTAPRGMVSEWAFTDGGVKKTLAWHLYQRRVFEQAALFHATARAEATRLRELGFSQPIACIPNGVTLPDSLPNRQKGVAKRVLFLSRIHPKKGLPMLLDAWADVCPGGWILELVGPSEDGHRAELEELARNLGIEGTVTFSGPVDDRAKWQKYANADVFVLPSHSENFGIVVAEALAAQVPVITTTGTPWQEVETHKCGWWVEPTSNALAEALSRAVSLSSEQRAEMGQSGRELVKGKYTWSAIGRKMVAAYRWLAAQGQRPACIQQRGAETTP